MTVIDKKRLGEVKKRGLDKGAHAGPDAGYCAMEAFSYIRRIPFTDHPPCVSPVIASFMRNWNDSLPDDIARAYEGFDHVEAQRRFEVRPAFDWCSAGLCLAMAVMVGLLIGGVL